MRFSIKKQLFLLCILITAFLESAVGQDSVVVYSRTVLQSLRFSVPNQIMTDSVIKGLNAYSVADALKFFTGLQVKDYGGVGGLKTVNVRNLGAAHTTVLFNGIPVSNIQNGQVDLSKFSLDNIREIQLFTAGNHYELQPASAYVGGSALYLYSGNVNTISNEKTIRRIKMSTGSFGLLNPSLYYQWKPAKNSSIYLNGEYLHSNGRYKFTNHTAQGYDTTAVRQNTDITSYRLEGGLDRQLSKNTTWNTNLYLYQSERGLPSAIVNNNFTDNQRLWDKNYFVQSSLKYNASHLYQLLVSGKLAYDYTKYVDYGVLLTSGNLTNIYKSYEGFLSVAHRLQLKDYWTVDVATDYRYTRLQSNIYGFAFPERQQLLGAISSRWFGKSWDIQAGATANLAFDKVESGGKMPDRRLFGPNLAFSWQPLPENPIRLRAFYKENFRLPTFNDIYYTQYASSANLKLKPEKAQQLGIGLTDYWESKSSVLRLVTIQSDFYYNHVLDKIIAVPGTNLFRWQMTNIDKVKIVGVATQLKANLQWTQQLQSMIGLQYTWENSLNKSVDLYNFPVPYSPKNSGSVIFQNSYKSWNLNYSFLYVGGRYNTEDTRLIDSYLSPWYTHDISIRKKIALGSFSSTIAFDVNNILNQQYEVVLNYPMPGRNYRIQLQIQF